MQKRIIVQLAMVAFVTCLPGCGKKDAAGQLPSEQRSASGAIDRIERTGRAKELWDAANTLEGNEALRACDALLQLNPKDHEAWHIKAYFLGRSGRPEEQLSAYDQLLRLRPHYAVAWRQRANCLSKLKRYREAIKSFEKALAADSQDPMLFRDRGMLFFALGWYSEALADFERARSLKIADIAEIDDLVLGLKRVLRQLDGTELPPKEWRPRYDGYANIMRIDRPSGPLFRYMAPEGYLPTPPSGGAISSFGVFETRLDFGGSEDEPIPFVPNFDVWDGAYIKDDTYGVLLENGTRIMYTRIDVKSSRKVITRAVIQGWKVTTLSVERVGLAHE